MLTIGIRGKEERIVTNADTAEAMESGELQVFATPAMVALMEKTAWKSVADFLEEGTKTVGISLEIRHLSATPLGMRVTCESSLTEIDGKKLTFLVKVYDEKGLIGEGRHTRFIVNAETFLRKTEEKAG